MRSEDPLLTLTLSEAWPRLIYTASCKACKHRTRVDLKKMAAQLGDDFPLRDLRTRLQCPRCEGDQFTLMTLEKSSTIAGEYLERWPFDYD